MKAIDRLYEFLDYKGIKPSVFERDISFSSGYLSVQRKRNADMGESQLTKVINYFDDINPIWLLTGNGNMITCNSEYKYHNDSIVSEKVITYNTEEITPILELIRQLAKKDDNIQELNKEIRLLIEDNSRLKEKIAGLIEEVRELKEVAAQSAPDSHSAAG